MKLIFLVLTLCSFCFSFEAKSSIKQATLLELFTSEGCDSCPPADDWANKFQESDDLFKKIIPVVYHVDYWDRLGWKDKYAKSEYTQRQYNYSRVWRRSSVYTPGFVLNGTEFRNWWGYRNNFSYPDKRVGVLSASLQGQKVNILFDGVDKIGKDVIIEISVMGMDYVSKIESGENSGKTLHHSFVSLALESYQGFLEKGKLSKSIILPYFKKENGRQYAVAIWISDASTRRIIQAVGAYL